MSEVIPTKVVYTKVGNQLWSIFIKQNKAGIKTPINLEISLLLQKIKTQYPEFGLYLECYMVIDISMCPYGTCSSISALLKEMACEAVVQFQWKDVPYSQVRCVVKSPSIN